MSVHVSEAGLRLPMVNMSDHHVGLKQGKLVGRAEEELLVRPLPDELLSIMVVREAAQCDEVITVPDHLGDLYERSKLNLSNGEQLQVAGSYGSLRMLKTSMIWEISRLWNIV
ncbi:hypothetical protein DPMN_104321 [Dreissena polymorpha]|uniref:Uncharacterized protein n=1 Tax=Dreissena polymorpha TaxID=45954 RepID=A0A9D4HBD2_DREPO|nr:hypothetical protein DPMN_104321 [Dreissena polymorpha]